MKQLFRMVILTSVLCLLSSQVLAEVQVLDGSENEALIEQQVHRLPVASADSHYDDKEPALARETNAENSNSNNALLINKIQGLQQDIQELRGQLEMQAHDLKVLQAQQLSFYNDLDARITGRASTKNASNASAQLEIKDSSVTSQSAATNKQTDAVVETTKSDLTTNHYVNGNINPADEQISYLKAYELVKSKQYDEALTAMKTFVEQYPQGGYTANGEYWLGELYLQKRQYDDAISHFSTVLQQFPSSSKYSASLLKIGYALADSGRLPEAKARLQEVLKKYPDTSTATLARLKLETLGG